MQQLIKSYRLLLPVVTGMTVLVIIAALSCRSKEHTGNNTLPVVPSSEWQPPDSTEISKTSEGELVRYGRELVVHTSHYLGPRGTVAAITNGMNCQNCHLDAGTRLYGNNYSAVFSLYPKFRERSGTVENIYKRVNDCLQRSLNGKITDTSSREIQAIAAYINWVGHTVSKNVKPAGAGITDLAFMDRAADPAKGNIVYVQKCQRCHGVQGEGLYNIDSSLYIYPPLWGTHSYTTAAGLYRISRFAGYVKDNMPFGATHQLPQLTNEEAWDVAAFVNSQSRPQRIFKKDWPDIMGKPVDHPFGPYADHFSETNHKYGPFEPIKEAKEKMKQKK